MGIIEILLMALGFSMNFIALSVGKGIALKTINKKSLLTVGIYFCGLQALAIVLGWGFGLFIKNLFLKFIPMVSFALLFLIGINMIYTAFKDEYDDKNDSLKFVDILKLGKNPCLCAVAIGVILSFVYINIKIYISAVIFSVLVFLFSVLGLFLGNKNGEFIRRKAQIIGGLILILIGVKILTGEYLLAF